MVWFPAVLVRAEIILAEEDAETSRLRACFYETAEAVARARELQAAPVLWRLLLILGLLSLALSQHDRAKKYLGDASRAFRSYLKKIPKRLQKHSLTP